MVSDDYHKQFMAAALEEAAGALRTGEFPVGCVLVFREEIIASGGRRNSFGKPNEIDHAELVALRALVDQEEEIDLSEVIVYSTMEPCLMCFSSLILSGIRTIVYGYEDVMGGGTALDLGKLPPLYAEMNVKVFPHVMRNECLKLFKMFFENPQNHYWQDSLLARYTLEQKV